LVRACPLKRFLQREFERHIRRVLVAGEILVGANITVALPERQIVIRH